MILPVKTYWISIVLTAFFVIESIFVILCYQRSFYPLDAPGFVGISNDSPFLCAKTPHGDQIYEAKAVFEKILSLVEANPKKQAPEFGMLALGTQDLAWAEQFRSSLLAEARQGNYTHPVNSVKSLQYLAALRAYYYSRVSQAFPNLFTVEENQMLSNWFAAINRRAQTVEWIDWFYALAYRTKPEGPYENQEIGAGLLAMLESQSLADPRLSRQNLQYMDQNPRGWLQRFRNTDDSFFYQPEWITNSWFQYLYNSQARPENIRLSFQWLAMQSLPDGATLTYNHPTPVALAGISYLGAEILKDPGFIWVAGRSADYLEEYKGYLNAIPGVEKPVILSGADPEVGTCLMYGDSGLPNQIGPLAPDKIVFRDGWNEDASYLLLNLRFTGWHRYKATNSVVMLYQNGQLVNEDIAGAPFKWFPAGRRLYRDKRIPRENLNGLVIQRTGLNAVLSSLTGSGGNWAQDPPYYAQVENFETSEAFDKSVTLLEGWHGWNHRRSITFYHHGPVIFFDQAWDDSKSPLTPDAMYTWHFPGAGVLKDSRLQIRAGSQPAEVLFIPMGVGQLNTVTTTDYQGQSQLAVQYHSNQKGQLGLITIFLTGEWTGAKAEITSDKGIGLLRLTNGEKQIALDLGDITQP